MEDSDAVAEGTEQYPDSGSETAIDGGSFNVAFWNLQNLFDIEGSPIATDHEFTPVNGWDKRALKAKISNVADVIRSMFNGRGPDLLGLCEIENDRLTRILIDAIGRDDYELAHCDQPDIHGIGTTLIYSKNVFDIDQARTAGHLVHQRYPTRDIFEVHLTVQSNQSNLTVLVNHWPSRSPSRPETEPWRLTVASQCCRLLEENLKLNRREYLQLRHNELSLHQLNSAWDRNVLLMGDFNDEPWSRSVREVLGAAFTAEHIEEPIRMSRGNLPSYKAYAARKAWLFNPMWTLAGRPDGGTCYVSDAPAAMHVVDQFLLSRGLYFGLQGLQLKEAEPGVPHVSVYRPEVMCTRKGRPREFVRETRSGYSDHFPITTTVRMLNSEDTR